MRRISRLSLPAVLYAVLAVIALPARLAALDPEKRITQFVHTAWTPRDGAPRGIKAIAQTPDGYLWLASLNAIHRFDGMRFLPWSPPGEWADRLDDQPTGNLMVSRDGTLWMSVGGGLGRVSGQTFTWSALPTDKRRITNLVEEDDRSLLLLVEERGLFRFDRISGTFQRLTAADGIPPGMPFKMAIDRDQTVWLSQRAAWPGASGRRWNYDGTFFRYSTEFTLVFKPRGARAFQPTGLKLGQVHDIAQSADGTVWVAETARSVRILRSPNGRLLPPGPEIYLGSMDILMDRHSALWISTLGDGLRRVPNPAALGTAIIGKSGGPVEAFTEDHGLSGDVLYTTFEDREGNLWFGGTNGLDRFREVRLAELTAKEGVRLNVDQTVLAAGARAGVTVATSSLNGLLYHVDRAGHIASESVYENATGGLFARCGTPGNNTINIIYRAPDGTFWAAGERLFTPATGGGWRCIPLESPEGPLPITAMTAARAGGLWLGTAGQGLWHYQIDGTLTRAGPAPIEGAAGMTAMTVLFEQEDGSVWVGGRDGLARIRGQEILVVDEAKGLRRGGVYAIFSGERRELWVLGPRGLGLLRDDRITIPPGPDRLPLAGCWSSLRDGASFWFNCQHGLLRIPARELDHVARDPDHTPEYELFDASDDLRSAPVQGGANSSMARSPDGRIWFLTQKGLGYIDPGRLDASRHPPPVYIVSARSGDSMFDVGASPTLRPLSNALDIAFTAISLGHPERLRFRYRLEGADPAWRETNDRSVSYGSLAAGDYRLRVRARDHLGTWSDEEAAWSFTVAPRWYQRWWFRLTFSAFIVMLVWLIAKVGFARQAASLRRDFSVQLAERTRIAGELHDTLLQGFQGTTMQLHALEMKLQPDSPERRHLAGLLTEVQSVLDEGRKAIWAMRESAVTGPDLKVAFTRVAAHMDVASPAFHISEQGDPRSMNPHRRDIVYQLGREALINAYQHSGGQHIYMTLTWKPEWVRLTVQDDGVGIPEHIVKGGREGHFGLRGMRERAERLRAPFEVRSDAGRGTYISIVVPGSSLYLQPVGSWYRHLMSRLWSWRDDRP